MDMYLLLMSLKAIERVCKQEKSNAQYGKKSSNKGEKGNKQPVTKSTIRVPKKACTKKHCNLCKKHGGARTTHNTRDCSKYEKDGSEKANSVPPRKEERNPILQSSLSRSWARNWTSLRRSAKLKKHHSDNSNSDSEYWSGSGSIEKVETWVEETVEKTTFTPSSLTKATPTLIASNQDDVCPTSFSNAGDITLTSSSQY